MTMKRLAFLLASLFISLSAFSQMVRENPVAGCKITKQYGMETITYTLSGKFHIAKPGEFADLKVYIVKPGRPADMVVKFLEHDSKPRFCGEWLMTESEGIAIKFVDSPEKANFRIRMGDPEKEYGYYALPN